MRTAILGSVHSAALIFAGAVWDPSHPHHRHGSGRMQKEIFSCLQHMGLRTYFAGQEDKVFSNDIINSDIIVSLVPPVSRFPARCCGILLIYTCNTHVKEREKRLKASMQRWKLPYEPESSRNVDEYLLAYKRADYLLIAENEHGINNFLKHGIPSQKIKRYNNCVDVDIWKPNEKKRDKFSFICYGSVLGLRKGLPALLAAWKKWYRGQNAELYLIGTPSIVSDELLGGAKEGNVLPGVHIYLKGYPAQHPPIIQLISSCHVAVFPTLEDAQPSSLLEMASCGLPVITTIESGVEFTTDFCHYVPADSVEVLCEAFEIFYQRQDETSDRGQIAREYIIENHSWPHFRNRFSSIIREVMADI